VNHGRYFERSEQSVPFFRSFSDLAKSEVLLMKENYFS